MNHLCMYIMAAARIFEISMPKKRKLDFTRSSPVQAFCFFFIRTGIIHKCKLMKRGKWKWTPHNSELPVSLSFSIYVK